MSIGIAISAAPKQCNQQQNKCATQKIKHATRIYLIASVTTVRICLNDVAPGQSRNVQLVKIALAGDIACVASQEKRWLLGGRTIRFTFEPLLGGPPGGASCNAFYCSVQQFFIVFMRWCLDGMAKSNRRLKTKQQLRWICVCTLSVCTATVRIGQCTLAMRINRAVHSYRNDA